MGQGCFPNGECICSAPFMAAGIDSLQLLFYPSGYKGCTAAMCSLFVYGPAGCRLKGTLWLGTHKRDADHSFGEGGACGRTNFCRFDKAVNEVDDTVMVVLDIEEASMDTVANMSQGSGASAVRSTMKLASHPGKEGLNHAFVLPSLWTVAMKDSRDQPVDGMRSFDELKAGRPPAGGDGGAASPTNLKGVRMPRSHSTPSLAGAAPGTGDADGDIPVSLPPVSGTAAGAPCGQGSPSRRRQRRPGPSGPSSPVNSATF